MVSPLQLPGPLVVPQLDFSPLNTIGDAYLRHSEREREKAEFAKVVDTLGSDEAPTAMPRAPQAPGMLNQAPAPANAPGGFEFLDKVATDNGLDPRAFRRYAMIESGFNPAARTGKYVGLFQVDPDEFAKSGGKNPEDAFENATFAAKRLRANSDAFKQQYGRDPTATELYMSHQQGMGGLSAHMAAPGVPAWQNMLATREAADRAKAGGPEAAEKWARAAIWGNVPDQLKQRFGSVDNVTSGDFLKLWQGKVEGGMQQPQQSSVGRGLQLNNPGNIPDGPMAKALPGYKGGQDGLAVFDSPDNGLGAMDALLISYGRRGLNTVRDIVSRWTSDPKQVESYATYVGNGNPDAKVDLSNPDQRREIVQRLARAENGGASERKITPEAAARIKAMFNVGTPAAQQAAYALLSKYIGKQEPIKLSEGDVLVDPNNPGKIIGRAPGKMHDVRPGGALIQDGKVVYQAPAANAGEKIDEQVKQRAAIAKERGLDPNDERVNKWILTGQLDIKPEKGEQLEDVVEARERIAKKLNMDPTSVATQAFIATGKHPGDEKVTSTALKMIGEAEDENVNLTEMVRQLEHAKELNPQIYTGFGAGARTWLGTKMTDKAVPDFIASPEQAQATEQWLAIMEPGALDTMARTLKGATTDFELRRFTKLLADPTTTEKTRGEIIDKMLRMAQGKLSVNQARMDELRGGTYTKAGGGQSAPRAQPKQPPKFGTPEFEKLPSGEQYVAPDGSVRTKR